ncbi:2-dehydropantoate 2-reductase [Nocardia sp. NPDC049149]|uniref:2-dehydropantoate 2-reductase n=1 Tax=Nocardia sp. NPDC049149 TaxID=3364315 RepID=UPI00372116B5
MRFAVVGAGSVGCYIGARLQVCGHTVVYIGRRPIADAVATHGLEVSDYRGWSATVDRDDCWFTEEMALAATADAVFVTVKSGATRDVAALLGRGLSRHTSVISLQNGIRNAAQLARECHGVAAGTVGFTVARVGPTHFRQASKGGLTIGPAATDVAAALTAAGLPTATRREMLPLQWGKLLLHLNNAVNGLSGLTLGDQLAQRDFRRVYAAAVAEGLGVLRIAGQPVASPLAIPLAAVPRILRAPDSLFARAAQQFVPMDPTACSSMADDLAADKPTEVDYLNGEIVAMAARLGTTAPVNAALVKLVHDTERTRRRPWSADALLAAVGATAQ